MGRTVRETPCGRPGESGKVRRGEPITCARCHEHSSRTDRDESDALMWQNRGSAYIMQARYAEAVADLDRAIQLLPHEAHFYTNRGICYRHLGHPDLALADYAKAIEINPQRPESYTNRGALYLSQKDFEKAEADFAKALELDPNNAGARNGLRAARSKDGTNIGTRVEAR